MAKSQMFKKRSLTVVISVIIFFFTVTIAPVKAQYPFIQYILVYSRMLRQIQDNSLDSACIRLDGRCLFKLAATELELSPRIREIQTRLNEIKDLYLQKEDPNLNIRHTKEGVIYIKITDKQQTEDANEERLFNVTNDDARLYKVNIQTRAEQLVNKLEDGLQRAKQERQKPFLIRQGIIAIVIITSMLLSTLYILRLLARSHQQKQELDPSIDSDLLPISNQLSQRQQWNIKEVQYRLLQWVQVVIWLGGILFILGLFPYTRIFQFLIIAAIRIPIRIIIVGLITYLLVRLTYAFIAKSSSAFLRTNLLNRRINQRRELRVATIARIARGIVTIVWISIGVLVALSLSGIDVTPLLAGAGILGLAISFASQNLIKDTINGFFIILEDQYAVGDIIKVGDVDGLVENINLRITQLRDAGGRLITIPNSEVRIVANLSSQWSRADLSIPIPYQADIDKALQLIHQVAEEMSKDADWRDKILESPQVLGIDNFSDRGAVVRVWIKTEPLKQWDVGREFRRRLKVTFDRVGIIIPPPQQQVWFNRE
ncbi:MAG: mechanosensitive ion channel family protein [Xenococcaceae cyanobacterium MO_188.B32]|nr:mechanosensitive ion channel family protein [Xenococcaceae cyanobacterium MO_188.B32]